MKYIICESYLGEEITFNYSFPFFLESIDGIHEISGDVTRMQSAFAIGEKYIDTSINKRNIIIKGSIRKNDNIIERRQTLYRLFPLKTIGTLYYYEGNLSRKINYYVESVEIAETGLHRKFQISLICPNPYFTDINKTSLQMATWKATFKFPLIIPQSKGIKFGVKNPSLMASINNTTNIEFGMTITFIASDTVVNPSLFNVDSREEIKIEKTMKVGDKIIINTYRQNKNIIYIDASTGLEENINNLMVYGSKFLQVHHGQNTFRYNADENAENLQAVIDYYTEYEAI